MKRKIFEIIFMNVVVILQLLLQYHINYVNSTSIISNDDKPAYKQFKHGSKSIDGESQYQISAPISASSSLSSGSDKFLEKDGELSKKIIGSSVATSVSVILNGNEPQFTDAVGKPIPKPILPLQVASPINLLNPDRYEFYTFDDNGELIKRLMTLKEIQSIVANGDGEGATILHNMPINDRDPEKNVHDIVASVQNVLTKEVEWKKNSSGPTILDTPDVSASWSMILPTIFGNTGGEIFPAKPQQVVMTPDTDVVETSTKKQTTTTAITNVEYLTQKPTIQLLSTTQKPKLPPRRRPSTKKPITTSEIPQKVFVNNQEYVKPIFNRIETTSPRITTKPTAQITSSLKPKPSVTILDPEEPTDTKIITIRPKPTITITSTFKPSTTHTTPYKIDSTTTTSTKRRPTPTTTTKLSTPSSTISFKSSTSSTTATKVSIPSTTSSSTTTTTMKTTTTTKKTMPTTQATKIQFTSESTVSEADVSSTNAATIIPSKVSITSTTTTTVKPYYSSTLFSPSLSPSPITPNILLTMQSSQTPYEISSSTLHSTPEETRPQMESLTEISDVSSAPSETDMEEDDENTTLSINNIITSLTQAQEDKNTKLSFDQILESLKDSSSSSSSPPSSTLTSFSIEEKPSTIISDSYVQNIQNQTTVHPVMYNGGEVLISSDEQNKNSNDIPVSIVLEKENNNLIHKPQMEQIEQGTEEDFITTTQYINEIDEKFSSEKVHNSSNVVHFEPLYVEIKDPILMDITTTESANILQTTNLINDNSSDDNNDNYNVENDAENQTLQPDMSTEIDNSMYTFKPIENYSINNTKNITKLSNDNEMKRPVTFIGQEIENLISNALNQTQHVSVNIGNKIKPVTSALMSGNINMPDFKQQAATLASTLESSIQSTEHSINAMDSNNEIEALLSDVINQITDIPSTSFPIKSQMTQTQTQTSNRLSGLAQINSAIFVPPPSSSSSSSHSQDIKSQFHQNDNEKFDSIDSMSIQSSDVIENVSDKMHQSLLMSNSNDATDKTTYMSSSTATNHIISSAMEHKSNEISSSTTNTKTSQISSDFNDDLDTVEITTIAKMHRIDIPEETTKSSIGNDYAENDEFENDNEDTTQSQFESVTELEDQKDEQTENAFILSTTPNLYDENSDEKQLALAIQSILTADETNKNLTLKDQVDFLNYFEQNDSNSSLADDQIITTEHPESSTILIETQSSTAQRKEDRFKPTPITDIFNITETEQVYIKLGESTQRIEELKNTTPILQPESLIMSADISDNTEDLISKDQFTITTYKPVFVSNQNRNPLDDTRSDFTETTLASKGQSQIPSTLKPVQYYKQPNDQKFILFIQRPASRPPALSNLKVGQISQSTRIPVKLDPAPEQMLGLEESTVNLQEDIQEFARLCNELAFSYWKSITAEKISPARSLILSPFALTSMLSMVFLGARGSTSGEMNEILKLDEMVTFNPHLIFKNITESVERSKDSHVASAAFVREIFSDRNNGKILQFFKEKTQQLYSGHVEEVNFNVVNDIIRRRTNLLMKRHTLGKVTEYLRTNSVWVNGPLATVSANLFQTDCSKGSVYERDGEMFFQVHPSVRQRRLVPIPAVVWRSGFTAGYDPDLDATAVAFGSPYDIVSTIFLMPGQQGLAAPGDNLDRLEKNLLDTAIAKNSWSRLLTSLMERPGLEVQLPRFSHRSFINASLGLQKMGLKALFNSEAADLRGLTGSSNKDVYLSDMIQINTFSTCAEEKITDHHHVEMYPAPPLRRFNADVTEEQSLEMIESPRFDFGSLIQDNGRAFYDDLLDPKYLELPLPLRPRQARIPDAPRLRFDKPFLYFVRHNPTGMILFMGRFNPRLLP